MSEYEANWLMDFPLINIIAGHLQRNRYDNLSFFEVVRSSSYSTAVLYIGIIKVWGFLPKNPTYKPA